MDGYEIKYALDILDGEMPEKGGPNALLIDVVDRPLNPFFSWVHTIADAVGNVDEQTDELVRPQGFIKDDKKLTFLEEEKMCCFFTSLMLFGPRLAIIVWYLYRPVYVNSAFGSFFGALIGFAFLPWSTLMYLSVYPGGIFGWEWLLVGMGIFADMAGYFGGYKNKNRVPYGDQIP